VPHYIMYTETFIFGSSQVERSCVPKYIPFGISTKGILLILKNEESIAISSVDCRVVSVLYCEPLPRSNHSWEYSYGAAKTDTLAHFWVHMR